MVVEASSFRANGIADLEAIFHETCNLRTLLALEAELDRRKTPRARELRGKVRQQLVSLSAVDAREVNAEPWYRRRRMACWPCRSRSSARTFPRRRVPHVGAHLAQGSGAAGVRMREGNGGALSSSGCACTYADDWLYAHT